MSVELINPDGLPQPFGYAHVGVATGTRQVFISGQVGHDADGNLVGDDLASQTEQAYANLHTAITAAGGSFAASPSSRCMSWTTRRTSCATSARARRRPRSG